MTCKPSNWWPPPSRRPATWPPSGAAPPTTGLWRLERALADERISQNQRAAEAEFNIEDKLERKQLEAEKKKGQLRLDQGQKEADVRIREREAIDRIDRDADTRLRDRITQRRRLLADQAAIANRIAGAGANGRSQIGWVTDLPD